MSDVRLNHIFSSFLVETELDLDHWMIADYCRNAKPFEHDNTMVDFDLDDPNLKEMFSQTESLFNQLHQNTGLSKNKKQIIHESWANLDSNNRTGTAHMHATAHFVGVYYPKAEEGSSILRLFNPCTSIEHVYPVRKYYDYVDDMNEFNTSVLNITPRTGLFIMFPSWIYHQVIDLGNPAERISIAINTKLIDND